MTISEINEETKEALCVWYDPKGKKMHKEWLPVNTLKLTPERTPIDKDKLFQAIGYKP
jgi:hypothetical protein